MEFDKELINKVWDNIEKTSEDKCWNWIGKIRNNLPIVCYYENGKSNIYSVKRIVYEIYYKIEIKRKTIKQLCNNVLCCNPKHLFIVRMNGSDNDKFNDQKFLEYFWNKVDIRNDDECWNWLGDVSRNGNGLFFAYDKNGKIKSFPASHFVYKLNNEDYKSIKKIYYKCGNKLCCNPQHLSINKKDKKFVIDQKQLNRFWSKVNVKEFSECWEWRGAKDQKGYGTIYFNKKIQRAHRVSFILTHGVIGNNLCVLHYCDNPSCVNPNHLFLGTVKDNSDDMIKKGREYHPSGSKHPVSKLTEEKIYEIVDLIQKDYTYADIAKLYKVVPTTINRIATGTGWKNVKRPIFKRGKGYKSIRKLIL